VTKSGIRVGQEFPDSSGKDTINSALYRVLHVLAGNRDIAHEMYKHLLEYATVSL
jgi:hypothetical protein